MKLNDQSLNGESLAAFKSGDLLLINKLVSSEKWPSNVLNITRYLIREIFSSPVVAPHCHLLLSAQIFFFCTFRILNSWLWEARLDTVLHTVFPNFTFVSIFNNTSSLLQSERAQFISSLSGVNRRHGTRKALSFHSLLPASARANTALPAQGTSTMSGHFSSQLWFNTGSPSIMRCCLWAHLRKSHSASVQKHPPTLTGTKNPSLWRLCNSLLSLIIL